MAKISAMLLAIMVMLTPNGSIHKEQVHEPVKKLLVEELKEELNEPEYKGVFECTAYCPCEYCCGNSCGLTYGGTSPQEGRTVGVDKNIIPIGTKLYIEDLGYFIAEDTGNFSGNVIDVYMESHERALEFGRQTHKVYIVKEPC